MYEQRSLEINVISAKDLQDVNLVTKMDMYVVVSISGDQKNNQKVKTNVDRGSGTKPTWNFSMKLFVDESLAQSNRLTLVFRLICDRSLGDKHVGEVNVPVKELLDSVNAAGGDGMRFVSYQVRKPSGTAKGELNFSYRFGEKFAGEVADGEPVKGSTAVPASTVAGSSCPPPPMVAYGNVHGPPPVTGFAGYTQLPGQPVTYGGPTYPPPVTGFVGYTQPPDQPVMFGGPTYPPPVTGSVGYTQSPGQPIMYGGPMYSPPVTGYGYSPAPPSAPSHQPPPVPGYGYGPHVSSPIGYGYGYTAPPPSYVARPPRNNKSKFGLGLGAGLVGGVIGGMLIGDVVSDVASCDLGFDDVGGFDF